VNKAPGNIGFLHLSLQEYLAARHLMQFSAGDKIAFMSENAGALRWREPILYLLAMTPNEADTGQLVEAIEKAQPGDIGERAARDALLADAVFADFSHDLDVVRRIAQHCLAETESTAWGQDNIICSWSRSRGCFPNPFATSVGKNCPSGSQTGMV
jgi:hypothetical protein